MHAAYFGEGTGLILVDNIFCTGNESTLFECFHLGIGNSNCFHDEDVSILCQSECVCEEEECFFVCLFLFNFLFILLQLRMPVVSMVRCDW